MRIGASNSGRELGCGQGGAVRPGRLPRVAGGTHGPTSLRFSKRSSVRERGSVLIIVLWIAFGLVALALYFANSMTFELRAADNRVASIQADQAIAGAARQVNRLLALAQEQGLPPYLELYQCEAVPVGDATFWLIGRDELQGPTDQPYFGLVDEASKLDLNTATVEMLEMLPRMTSELAANIIAWREPTNSSTATTSGAKDETYQRLIPAYRCKSAPFESVDELRLVYGATVDILYGEDANLNGVLDPNENDGEVSSPTDNRDGRLDPGLLEFVTVYTKDSNLRSDGTTKIPIDGSDTEELRTLLEERLGADRANQILALVGGTGGGGSNRPPGSGSTPGTPGAPGAGGSPAGAGGAAGGGGSAPATFTSLLDFYIRSSMTAEEFAQIEGDITLSTNKVARGLVNVNTASEAVLACLPGIGTDFASALVAYRQSKAGSLTSLAWVVDVVGKENATLAGPYLTARSYQFTADVAALGHFDRGYRRVKFVFDTSESTPRIVFRQDLTHLGWALGQEIRRDQELARQTR